MTLAILAFSLGLLLVQHGFSLMLIVGKDGIKPDTKYFLDVNGEIKHA